MKSSGRLRAGGPAPRAEQRPHRSTHHDVDIDDPWFWLRDPDYPQVSDPDILAYLEAENAYFDDVMGPHQGLVDSLFEEMRGRQKEDDAAVPWRRGDWWYRWRFDHGAQYRIWSRRPVAGGDEEIILDEPALARDFEHFQLGALAVSHDGRLLAWSVDTEGSERFRLRIRDLERGVDLDDEVPDTMGSPVWTADGQALLYAVVNASWRPYEIRMHRLGTAVADDIVLYTEADEGFFVGVSETSDAAWIVVSSGDHVTSEARLLDPSDPTAEAVLVAPRRAGHQYEFDHAHGRLWMLTNDVHENFRLVSAPAQTPQPQHWREEIAASARDYLTDLQTFADVLVLESRRDGLDQIRVRSYAGDEYSIAFDEAAYSAGLGTNAEFDTDRIRIGYASMVTPDTVFDHHLADRRLQTLKVREVPSGYDRDAYVVERLVIEARDGTAVPVSLVHHRDLAIDGTAPLYLYGYGAYGLAIPPSFSAARLSLLQRGMVFAIAHVRGGDDLGYGWYTAGKLEQRHNTFDDFVDVARGLCKKGYSRPGRVVISGGSAGGELVGVAMNQAPELFGAVVAHVPFVDVLATMLDGSLPLTPMEWPEWGNPLRSAEMFELIRSYSPVDQLRATDYPPLLATAGLADPRVTYWEPAKWVARQRELRTDDAIVLLKTNMSAGHGGVSGRWESLRELAEEYAFILAALDL